MSFLSPKPSQSGIGGFGYRLPCTFALGCLIVVVTLMSLTTVLWWCPNIVSLALLESDYLYVCIRISFVGVLT